jgi:hypothetical protein
VTIGSSLRRITHANDEDLGITRRCRIVYRPKEAVCAWAFAIAVQIVFDTRQREMTSLPLEGPARCWHWHAQLANLVQEGFCSREVICDDSVVVPGRETAVDTVPLALLVKLLKLCSHMCRIV